MTTSRNDENGLARKERRRSSRAKISPKEIVYMNFQSGNGGIVVDASSAGLGFQAAAPVERTESLSFRLSSSTVQHIDISGQVVWLDDTRKRGGLRLNNLPVEVKAEIQRWRQKSLDVEPPAEVKANDAPENAISAQSRVHSQMGSAVRGGPLFPSVERSQAPAPIQERPSAVKTPFASVLGSGLGENTPISSSQGPSPTLPALMKSSQWQYSALSNPEKSQGSQYGFKVFLVALILIIAGGLVFGDRQRAGDFLIQLGKWIAGEQPKVSQQMPAAIEESRGTEAPTTSTASGKPDSGSVEQGPEASERQAPTSTVQQPQSGVDEMSLSAETNGTSTDTGVPSSGERRASVQPKAKNVPESTERRGPSSAPGDNGGSELAQARMYLQGTRPADKALAAQLLWVAIGKGSSDAEVELAGLYLRGEGVVPKNCEQARILLMAAQKNHVPEAGERLGHLRDYGCR